MNYCNQYKQLKPPSTLRSVTRNTILNLAAITNDIIDNNKPRIQHLFFHHVFDDEIISFRHLIQTLSQEFEFLPYSEAVDRTQNANIDRKYMTFSSDDGLLNNKNAAEIFQEFGIKACFFLNPYSIELKEDKQIAQFCRTRLNIPPTQFLTWRDISSLQNQGHEIGSHTHTHPNLPNLNIMEVQEELEFSKSILEQHCGKIKHFAYPYGKKSDFNAACLSLVQEAGYESCATGMRGAHFQSCAHYPLPVIFRDVIISHWPVRHIKFFIAINSLNKKSKALWK